LRTSIEVLLDAMLGRNWRKACPMSKTLFPAGPVDLEVLDQFLMSEASPENCMQLSDLDGFLTGIAIGPELLISRRYT
jgi:hypothetical protein